MTASMSCSSASFHSLRSSATWLAHARRALEAYPHRVRRHRDARLRVARDRRRAVPRDRELLTRGPSRRARRRRRSALPSAARAPRYPRRPAACRCRGARARRRRSAPEPRDVDPVVTRSVQLSSALPVLDLAAELERRGARCGRRAASRGVLPVEHRRGRAGPAGRRHHGLARTVEVARDGARRRSACWAGSDRPPVTPLSESRYASLEYEWSNERPNDALLAQPPRERPS